PSSVVSPAAEATAAIRAGVKAGRAVIQRAAAAIGTAVPAPSAAAGHLDDDGIAGGDRRDGCERHGLRAGRREQTEAERKSRSSKEFHGPFLSFRFPRHGRFVPGTPDRTESFALTR